MADQKGTKHDWSNVVSEASQHVQARAAAIEEAADQQRGAPRGAVLAVVGVLLAVVLAWDVYVFTRPPELPAPAVEAENLRYFVADAVDVVEDFRAEQGRLPTRAELGDLLDPEITYETRGNGFVVGAEGEGVSVEYDSRMPLSEWIASGGGAS